MSNDERVLLEVTCACHPCQNTAQVRAAIRAFIGDGGRIEIEYIYPIPSGWHKAGPKRWFDGFYCNEHPVEE